MLTSSVSTEQCNQFMWWCYLHLSWYLCLCLCVFISVKTYYNQYHDHFCCLSVFAHLFVFLSLALCLFICQNFQGTMFTNFLSIMISVHPLFSPHCFFFKAKVQIFCIFFGTSWALGNQILKICKKDLNYPLLQVPLLPLSSTASFHEPGHSNCKVVAI